jgi:predicted secreted protein
MLLVEHEYHPGGEGIGGGGVERFTLSALEAGEIEFVLEYRRSWESRPAETEVVRVRAASQESF